jgi:hypothetical protein
MNGYTGIKVEYNRKGKVYVAVVNVGLGLHAIHHGWFVFEDAATALDMVQTGRCLGSMDARKKAAVVAKLQDLMAIV